MSVSIINPGVGGITVETDPTALKLTGGAISGDLTVAQKVGIGGVVPVGATNKLAVHNGNIVFTAGFGLAFGDGTTQTTGFVANDYLSKAGNLSGLNSASTARSNLGLGSIATENSNSFARLSSSNTFTAKQLFTVVGSVAGLNVGVGGTDTANTTPGDMWIATNGASLNFRDGTGAWRQLVNTSGAAGITATSTTHVLNLTQNGTGSGLLVTNHSTSTLPAAKITNNGTGDSFVIDNGTPDVAFTINTDGRVGVGVAPNSLAAIKVDSGGIMFFDNTTQTTAATFQSILGISQANYDKEYVAQNLAPSVTSVSYNFVDSEVSVSAGEVLASKINSVGYANIYVYADNGPASAGIPANAWDGSKLYFSGDIKNGGAATYIYFSVGSSYPISYALTYSPL